MFVLELFTICAYANEHNVLRLNTVNRVALHGRVYVRAFFENCLVAECASPLSTHSHYEHVLLRACARVYVQNFRNCICFCLLAHNLQHVFSINTVKGSSFNVSLSS